MGDDRNEAVVLELDAGVTAKQNLDGHYKGKNREEGVPIDCGKVDSDVAMDEGSRDVASEVSDSHHRRAVGGKNAEQGDGDATQEDEDKTPGAAQDRRHQISKRDHRVSEVTSDPNDVDNGEVRMLEEDVVHSNDQLAEVD